MKLTTEEVKKALETVMDPELGRNLVELGMVRDIQILNRQVKLTIALTTLACPFKEQILGKAKESVMNLSGVSEVTVEAVEMNEEEKERLGLMSEVPSLAQTLNDIKYVIAVMSGKGGVGKSLVTGLLAISFARAGYKVGIFDADITGPSIPKMFGLKTRPQVSPLGITPVKTKLGIEVMSINLLLPHEEDAVIWRGPLISRAVKQFWEDIVWGPLDYLMVDLPPGTADAPLTVMQSLPLDGVVLVSSPQELAVMVVKKRPGSWPKRPRSPSWGSWRI